jgi:hypothetical protein
MLLRLLIILDFFISRAWPFSERNLTRMLMMVVITTGIALYLLVKSLPVLLNYFIKTYREISETDKRINDHRN